jgi:hypothetical protein
MNRVRLAHGTVIWHKHLGFGLLILVVLQAFSLATIRSGDDRPFAGALSARFGVAGAQAHDHFADPPPAAMLWSATRSNPANDSDPGDESESLYNLPVPFAGLLDVGHRRHSRFPSRLQIRAPFNLVGNSMPALPPSERSARQSRRGSIVRNFGSTFTPRASACSILTLWVC